MPENLDTKLVDMNKNRIDAPFSSQLLHGNKNTDHFSDSDSDSLPDLCKVNTNKSYMNNYCQQDNNGNISQINTDNEESLSKRKINKIRPDHLKFNCEIENHAESSPFVNIRHFHVKSEDCKNSKSLTGSRIEEDYTDQISLVLAVLPHVADCKARAMLKKYKGNVDLCVAALLDDCSPVDGPLVDLT